MKLDILVGGLNNPEPGVRLDVARVLGMLDETRALEALRQRFQVEADPNVRATISWAGKRLFEAQQANYSTIDELCRYFGVDREIENMSDYNEAELLKKLQDNLDSDLRQMKDSAQRKKMGGALAMGLAGAAVGGVVGGVVMGMDALIPGVETASSGLGARPQIGFKRNPPTAPTNIDISVWLKRLREAPQPNQREQAAMELGQLNNPAALPHLALAFVTDPSPQVQQTAQRFGKIVYWSAIYWEMEQDGSMEQEMIRRAEKLGKSYKKPDVIPSAPIGGMAPFAASQQAPKSDEPSPDQLAEILRRAEAARAKRTSSNPKKR
jgi:hypothetical protein